jgi:hypothetical protein
MKNFLLLLILFPLVSNSQILTMDIIQVKEGREKDYESIESFMLPVQQTAIVEGKKTGWYILKNIGGGDLSEIEDKGIVDYMILSVYKDQEQLKSDTWDGYLDIAKKAYTGKMSSRKVQRMMNSIVVEDNPRKDTRTYVMENIYYTKPNPHAVGNIYSVFPAEQLNEDYEQFEMEYYKPIWEKNILSGNHKNWEFNRIIDRTENAYQNLTHIIFNRGVSGATIDFPSDFLSNQLSKAGMASRKGFNTAKMEIIFMAN